MEIIIISGVVPKPKRNINVPPEVTLPVFNAVAKAKYTIPQGIRPFNMPVNKPNSLRLKASDISLLIGFSNLFWIFENRNCVNLLRRNAVNTISIIPMVKLSTFWLLKIFILLPTAPTARPKKV